MAAAALPPLPRGGKAFLTSMLLLRAGTRKKEGLLPRLFKEETGWLTAVRGPKM